MKPYGKSRWATMWPARSMLCLTALLIASCANRGAGDFCLVARQPIRIADEDRLTDDTARAILTYDNKGRALCGW